MRMKYAATTKSLSSAKQKITLDYRGYSDRSGAAQEVRGNLSERFN